MWSASVAQPDQNFGGAKCKTSGEWQYFSSGRHFSKREITRYDKSWGAWPPWLHLWSVWEFLLAINCVTGVGAIAVWTTTRGESKPERRSGERIIAGTAFRLEFLVGWYYDVDATMVVPELY